MEIYKCRAGGRIPFRGRGAPCRRALTLRPDVVGVKRWEVPRRCRPMRRPRANSCWRAAALFRQCLRDRERSALAADWVSHPLGRLKRGGKVAGSSTATARTFGAALSRARPALYAPRRSARRGTDGIDQGKASARPRTPEGMLERRSAWTCLALRGVARESGHHRMAAVSLATTIVKQPRPLHLL